MPRRRRTWGRVVDEVLVSLGLDKQMLKDVGW